MSAVVAVATWNIAIKRSRMAIGALVIEGARILRQGMDKTRDFENVDGERGREQ